MANNDGFDDSTPAVSPTNQDRKADEEAQNVGTLMEDATGLSDKPEDMLNREDSEKDPQDDVCSEKNWKDFLPYRLYNVDTWMYTPRDVPEHCTEEDLPVLSVKSSGGPMSLSIQSVYLQNQFGKVVDIQNFHNVTLSLSNIKILSPYVPLYHHLENMKANILADSTILLSDRNAFVAMYYLCTLGWVSRDFQSVRNTMRQGFITYENLWALFRPNDYALSLDPVGTYSISQVASVKLEETIIENSWKRRWYITAIKMDYSNGKFQKVFRKQRMEHFEGTRKIQDLELYPLSHHHDHDELSKSAILIGKRWKQFCEAKPSLMSYDGQAIPLTKDTRKDNYDSPRQYYTVALSGSVILDSNARSKVIKQAKIDGQELLEHPEFSSRYPPVHRDYPAAEPLDDDYVICPVSCTVFNPDDQEWYSVDMLNLKEKVWRPATFNRLVLESDTKEISRQIAKANTDQRLGGARDIIEGKGKGTVLLFYGPPGVGKTMAAEVLSEVTKKPLLKVNLGRISGHKNWEQSLEQTFHNAESWKGILLIDEAEIVLEKRTFERLTQNSWISVFLRKLEYHKGILILTTNLIDCIDDAFESRISYPVHFYELTQLDRHRIWTDFIGDLDLISPYKQALLNETDRWAAAEINGRQIRNILSMAESLAVGDDRHARLTPDHVDKILDMTLEFSGSNKRNAAKVKREYFKY